MQRVFAVQGGIKAYLADPQILLTEETRACVLCDDPHPMRIHGTYSRYALLPDGTPSCEIVVMRLYCPQTKQTVSLLPDFCIPRRQHGPQILGAFLDGWIRGKSLLGALRAVRAEAPGHSVAQSLLKGFRNRLGSIRTYVAGVRSRLVESQASIPKERRGVADVVLSMIADAVDAATAFLQHGVGFHKQCRQGLA